MSAGDPGAVATTVIADRIAHSHGRYLSRKERSSGGELVHYLYGTAVGVVSKY
jgi:hypothetical protein